MLAGLALLGARWWLGPPTPVFAATRTDLVQTVVASGRVETPLRVEIGSQVTGTVAGVPVARGQAVRQGQLLVLLESSEQEAALAQAKAGVAQARARLAQLDQFGLPAARRSLQQAEINLRTLRRQYQRTHELRARNFVGQAALDEARRNLQLAQSQRETARLQVQNNGAAGAERALALAALEQARAALAAADARLAQTDIVAPQDGVLIARNVERGDVVQPGKVLMVLSPAGPVQVVLPVDERNLALLRIGQQALVSADAYPSQRMPACIAYINPGVDALRGSVEVRLDVPAPPAWLRQDMTVSVDIEVARRAQALSVPAETIRGAADSQPWVMKVQNRRARPQPVTLGLRGTGRTEVLHGLAEGEQVLPSTATVAVGQRIRAQLQAFRGDGPP